MLSAIELYNLRDKTIGEKIVWLREHKSKDENGNYCFFSSKKLAKELKMSPDTLNRIEKSGNCTSEKLLDIADYFEVSIDWLLSRPNVGDAYCDLNSVCNYTGLSADAIDYISNKNTDYNFRVFIEFVIDYAKKHKSFVNSLSFLRNSAVAYHSEIEFHNVLSNFYEKGNLDDETKKELYILYKGNENVLSTKTQLFVLSSLKSDYNSTKYELSENIRDIVNEYSTSKIVNEKTNAYYSYAVFTDDETKMLNSNYIDYLKSKIKAGEDNEKE